jgi:hypothetical protein
VLVNATGVDVGTFTADAERPSLIRFLGDLRSRVAHGLLPIGGNASVTSTPVAKRVHVVAPLRVTGTIGARRVSLVLRGRTSIPTAGRIALTVRPVVAVPDRDVSSLGGRALLDYASLVSLTIARARQYETFLGNPDPTGRIATTYVFRSGHRAAAAPVISPRSHRSYTLLWLLAAAAALAGGAFVWARS